MLISQDTGCGSNARLELEIKGTGGSCRESSDHSPWGIAGAAEQNFTSCWKGEGGLIGGPAAGQGGDTRFVQGLWNIAY